MERRAHGRHDGQGIASAGVVSAVASARAHSVVKIVDDFNARKNAEAVAHVHLVVCPRAESESVDAFFKRVAAFRELACVAVQVQADSGRNNAAFRAENHLVDACESVNSKKIIVVGKILCGRLRFRNVHSLVGRNKNIRVKEKPVGKPVVLVAVVQVDSSSEKRYRILAANLVVMLHIRKSEADAQS